MSSNPFWDQQQQLYKMWTDNMNKIPGMEAYQEMYKNMVPNMPDMTEYWDKMKESMTNPMEYWSKMTGSMPNPMEYWNKMAGSMPNPMEYWNKMSEAMPNIDYWKNFTKMAPGMDSFAKMWGVKIPGMDIYTKVFEFWQGIGDPASFLKEFPEKYNDLVWEVFKGLLPDEVTKYFDKPRQFMQTCVDFYQNLFGPWMQIDEDIMKRMAAGETRAYLDFFRTFNDRYDETFSKVFNMMGMGLNRESNGEQMQVINSSIKMMFAVGELVALVSETCANSMNTLVERYQEGIKDGKAVTTFHEFYDLWYKVTEEALLALFDTDEFAKVFGDFADKSSQYMIALNKVYERTLSQLPIPTNKDMESLYRTVYDLRKEVRDLRREVDALKAAAPAAASSTETK